MKRTSKEMATIESEKKKRVRALSDEALLGCYANCYAKTHNADEIERWLVYRAEILRRMRTSAASKNASKRLKGA